MIKKILLLTILIAFTYSSNAQNISFGPVIGGVFYQSNNNNGHYQFVTNTNNNSLASSINFGAYLEYSFNEKIGLKNELTLNGKELIYQNENFVSPIVNFKFIDLSSNLKYDFGNEYRKGFYLLFGPRLSFMTKVPSNKNNLNGSFNKLNFGLQLGLGQRILKYVDLQGKVDYGLSPFFKSATDNSHKSSFFGAYISCNLDLERLINI